MPVFTYVLFVGALGGVVLAGVLTIRILIIIIRVCMAGAGEGRTLYRVGNQSAQCKETNADDDNDDYG